jgi:SAM-dependent methyltransferase
MLYLDPNVVVSFLGRNRVRLYHTFFRKNFIVSLNFTQYIDPLVEGVELEFFSEEVKVRFCDATEFTLWECMYNNPDLFSHKFDELELKTIYLKDFLEKLQKTKFVNDAAEPVYNLNKTNALDRYKGNVNEQIATESLFRKVPINKWWVQQKFEDDLKQTRKTPYRYVQEKFLHTFFEERLPGSDVLEIGSGTGYWGFQMAKYVNHITGIDYDKDYVKIANDTIKDEKNIDFMSKDISDENFANSFDGKKYDYIFMIDIFLFLFDKKFQGNLYEKRVEICAQFRKLLKPDGVFIIIDPHLFWLTPRFGSRNNPYGIITEYNDREFGVIPPLEEMTNVFCEAGLAIKRIVEPNIDEEFRKIDQLGYEFIKKFPQWIVWELVNRE